MEIFGGLWRSFEVVLDVFFFMEVSGSLWRSLEVFGGLCRCLEVTCKNLLHVTGFGFYPYPVRICCLYMAAESVYSEIENRMKIYILKPNKKY